ncbi:MAG: tRNA uridine-5-carboxymethylaminomethyl(34) synthesis GTPase MnmE, partial [FCB group bacterium]|nr:tRNA uridine-5-carboxymethylaminomethyl(34) synthesis GTPase MnmE [FCB group bacterium]
MAPATPFGVGGVAIVRLSGPSTKQIISLLLQKPKTSSFCLEPRQATLATLFDQNKVPFEDAVVTFFKAPHSYTGEDVVEISCHGNPIVVQKIVSVCCFYGARIAEPGEFTRRAFLNGKMDLIQAESVATFIHSQSEESTALNFRLLKGSLSKKFEALKTGIIKALSLVEFELDISEEELMPNLRSDLFSILDPLLEEIDKLIRSYRQGHLLTDGALVVIVGKTNVGKSTLLNALSEKDRAITSHHPGTTRDPIDVSLFIDGVPIKLVDTAGLRKAKSEIE